MENSNVIYYLSQLLQLKRSGDTAERIGSTLYNSKISLNPHQIKAALFAFHSPISKGVLLCDEVGLGKTIEAGIVISQYWLERKRNILIISPASLVRQWQTELEDKFDLPCLIFDSRVFKQKQIKESDNPFNAKNTIKIMSLNFAAKMKDYISKSETDLVVIDEAHKLRNVYNPSNVIANNIREAIEPFKKLLLTATPLQNNLMELYGLSLLIDKDIFGDKDYFKKKFVNCYEENKKELSDRLSTYVERTLREQVKKYVKYPKRLTKTFSFIPSEKEQELYDSITDLIYSNPSLGTGKSQTALIALILRKLLSSSTYAVLCTLTTIEERMKKVLKTKEKTDLSDILVDEDIDAQDETISDDSSEEIDFDRLREELVLVQRCIELAKSVEVDNKAIKLLEALQYLFKQVDEKRNKKILIFTESRKTQEYLFSFLNDNGYKNVVLFNGGNSDPKTKEIYNEWISRPENSTALTNSKGSNIRSALLDYFDKKAEIMIATEAGAEGLNIQFCSMLVNYDLPWNPQRVEQRIGRCHRFGQKNDVIVINFLNESNQIDARVYELLTEKFRLFDDVFGSSDEVLGALDDDSNFEKKIFEIYRNCRSPEEINKAFDELQEKYKVDINAEMKKTKQILLENFDEDLQKVFDGLMESAENYISQYEENFIRVCKFILERNARFNETGFELLSDFGTMKKGSYVISSKDKERINLRTTDVNGQTILKTCGKINSLISAAKFDLTNYKYKISELEKIKGKKGIIQVGKITIDSFESSESFVMSGRFEDGTFIDGETIQKLFRLKSENSNLIDFDREVIDLLGKDYEAASDAFINAESMKNNAILKEETEKIDNWANDKIATIEMRVEDLREKRKNLQKEYDFSTNSQEKISIENDISRISKTIKKLWLELAESEDEVDKQRKAVVDKLKKESLKSIKNEPLFKLQFEVI